MQTCTADGAPWLVLAIYFVNDMKRVCNNKEQPQGEVRWSDKGLNKKVRYSLDLMNKDYHRLYRTVIREMNGKYLRRARGDFQRRQWM